MGSPHEPIARAQLSGGTSAPAIHRMVRGLVAAHGTGGVLADIGCGAGQLRDGLKDLVRGYVGVDVVRFPAFPADQILVLADLDQGAVPLRDASIDVAVAVETIEHLENPRALVREMVRVLRPGGLLIVTTPNNRSLLSLLSLLVRGHFSAFLDPCYPAHLTALVERDLLRMAAENGLVAAAIRYSNEGRIPGSGRYWPQAFGGRYFSDNLALVAEKAGVGPPGLEPGTDGL